MRVFGCDAYVHVLKKKRTKLDSKSERCIFIGYKDGLKGYKLWNPKINKVVYNRDVVFREMKDVIKHEVLPKELEKIEFELKEEESKSTTEEEIVREAIDLKDEKLWKETIVDEITSLYKNKAWHLVELSAGRKPIGSKWVFKNNMNAEGKVEKYKAWLVEKGYSEVSGIDFGDIFSPIAKVASIRLFLSIVVTFDFEVEKIDVKQHFFTGIKRRDLHEAT
eukprot:PITA_35316